MAGIFLAPSIPVSPPSIDLSLNFPGISEMTFTPEGETVSWDLIGGDSGVLLMSKGLRGLGMPPVKRNTDESPSVSGSRYRGHRVNEREVFWPLLVYSEIGSQAWIEHDRKFWEGLEPDKVGTWTIVHPDGTSRSLRVRFVDDGDYAADRDPSASGWEVYGVHLVAEQPFWEGEVLERAWQAVSSSDFFNNGAAPPFKIGSGASIATATMSNPGRLESWPTWTVFGPTTSVDLGLNGKIVEAHFTVADGQALVVDTDPTQQTAYLYSAAGGVIDFTSGAEVTPNLGETEWEPIPPGESVILSLAMVGAGRVKAQLRPRYLRAW